MKPKYDIKQKLQLKSCYQSVWLTTGTASAQELLDHTSEGVPLNPCSQIGTFADDFYFMDLHCQVSRDRSAGRHRQKMCKKKSIVK